MFAEEKVIERSYENGFILGALQGNPQGFHLGYHRGAEIGAELGFYAAVIENYLKDSASYSKISLDKIKPLNDLKDTIDNFPRTNADNIDILELVDSIRAKYKKVCAQFKINIRYPESCDKFSF